MQGRLVDHSLHILRLALVGPFIAAGLWPDGFHSGKEEMAPYCRPYPADDDVRVLSAGAADSFFISLYSGKFLATIFLNSLTFLNL